MSEYVTLRAADGHEFSAYVARPAGEPIAGLVVVQEIFGVNAHIRSVADGYARDGFLAVAPALFDRIQPGIELGYEGADMQTAMSLIPKLDAEKSIARHRRGYRLCRQNDRQESRRHRLLLRRHAGLAVRHAASSSGGCRLLRRPHRQLRRRKTHLPGHAPLRQAGRAHSRRRSREGPRRAS